MAATEHRFEEEWWVEAAAVLHPEGPPLAPGCVRVLGRRIAEVSEGEAPRDAAVIRGGPGSVLMPGLVSAHTHLALGHLAHLAQDRPFLDWILNGIMPAMAESTRDPGAFARGADLSVRALVEGGVTAVGDNFLRDEGASCLRQAGLAGGFFFEVFGSTASDLDAYWTSVQPNWIACLQARRSS